MRLAFEAALVRLGYDKATVEAAPGGMASSPTWMVTRPAGPA